MNSSQQSKVKNSKMMNIKTTKTLMMIMVTISAIILLNACKRNNYYTNSTVFDNSKVVQATISGQVVNELGEPLENAEVRVGTSSYTTGADGVFFFRNLSTKQRATLITVEKSNYFKGYRTMHVQANKEHITRIMLIEQKNPVTFNAVTGGTIALNGGARILFPANAIMYKSNGTPYNGEVTVYAKWLDPNSNTINQEMPGDLRAIDINNMEKLLQTFGMVAVEMVDNSNNPLQMALGKTATLDFPIPFNLMVNAPASIPLWFFDETTGMWKQEGAATKVGNRYTGEVAHFSFWNVDVPGNFVQLDMTLQNASGLPLSNMLVRISNPGTGDQRYGYTNSLGYVSGFVPDNAGLNVEVMTSPCMNVIYSQAVTTFSTPVNLGTILITPPASSTASLSGTVVNCTGMPVGNAFVSIVTASSSILISTNATGGFNTVMPLCSLPESATVTAYNPLTMENGSDTTTINSGMNVLGIISACGTQNEYITWTSTVSGVPTTTTIVEPVGDFVAVYTSGGGGMTFISATDSITGGGNTINFTFNGVDSVSGIHELQNYSDHFDFNCLPSGTIPIMLSSYQTVGGWITGSFTGMVSGGIIPSRIITCNFHVKRD
jgi:hypothetical protein